MSRLGALIDRISAGQISAADAVPEFVSVLEMSRPRPEPGSVEWMAAEWEVDDCDTWTEVEAALIVGKLTNEQVAVLRDALTQGNHERGN